MKRFWIIFILCSILLPLETKAQNAIYKTYEDYQNNKFEEFDEFISWAVVFGNTSLRFQIGEEEVPKWCKSFWGFMYKGVLFRNTTKSSNPVRLVSYKKISYYENGIAHLMMLKNNNDQATFSDGTYCYFSDNLESDIIELPIAYSLLAEGKINIYRDTHPEYKVLFDCIGRDYHYSTVRNCVNKFESEEEE